MKSLDEHLRDASQAWSQDATPTLVSSADAIAKTLRPRMWTFPWGLSALGVGVVLSVGIYVANQYQSAESVAVVAKETTTQTPMVIGSSGAIAQNEEQDVVPEISSVASRPVVLPTSHHTTPATVGTRLKVEGQADGFTAEYERILSHAMSLEATDPLKAVNEYMGLVRLCERRGKYAHAVSALERASVLSKHIGDVNLKNTVDNKLSEIRGMLAP